MAQQQVSRWSLHITTRDWQILKGHLFPGDHEEHGAVLRCSLVETKRGSRLLVEHIALAIDGSDYVPGDRGYRKLDATFVRDNILACADDGLVYLAVHCHGGKDSVAFSQTDMMSHKRGYPALLDASGSPAVGALVFAEDAVAGDIWLADGSRTELDYLRVVGRPQILLRAAPPAASSSDASYDRQARIFGDRGQDLIGSMKVGIVGLGGAGSLVNEYLARLGVGHLVLIDPDHVEVSNLPRLVGALRRDAHPWMTSPERPRWMQQIGARFATKKVHLAARVARAASPRSQIESIVGSVADAEVAALLIDCDHIFLAADSALARNVVNAITHQYLIPHTQIGAKVSVDRESGVVTDVFSVSRYSSPGSGCLRCNGLISPSRLQEEAVSEDERARQRYVSDDGVHAPSVVTLNAVSAAHAVDDWLMVVTGLTEQGDLDRWTAFHPLTGDVEEFLTRKDPSCTSCGPRRLARGGSARLPTKASFHRWSGPGGGGHVGGQARLRKPLLLGGDFPWLGRSVNRSLAGRGSLLLPVDLTPRRAL